MRTRQLIVCVAVLMSGLTGGSCAGSEPSAVSTWMKFLPGTWTFTSVGNDVSGKFLVTKTALDHVLRVTAVNNDDRVFVVSMYVWNEAEQSLQLLGGYKTADDQGAFLVTFNKFAEDKLSVRTVTARPLATRESMEMSGMSPTEKAMRQSS